MPVGYLVGVIVVAVPTLFALAPLRSVPNLSFRLGLLLNEVPILLHGGGYTQGHKNSQSLPLLYRLASQGWVGVSANYRLRPAAQHPDT